MKKLKKVVITTGDIDGIGTEVTAKALARVRPIRGTQFYMWRSVNMPRRELKLIDRYFKRITVRSWPEALQAQNVDYYKALVDIESPMPPSRWVETAAQAGASKSIDGLVTAPISKTEIIRSGLRDSGHTGILKRVSKTKDVFMSFLGPDLNVTLLTGHVSIRKAYSQINQELLERCCLLTHDLTKLLPRKLQHKPIGLVGCNPHAGEEGVIDNKETEIFLPVVKKLRRRKIDIQGPLVPDVCFQMPDRKKHSFFVASYHDQGLIPFKMLHGQDRGVHYSLGLPFIRTSVDHGTAKDIFGKNKASSGSMESAIRVAVKLMNNKPIVW